MRSVKTSARPPYDIERFVPRDDVQLDLRNQLNAQLYSPASCGMSLRDIYDVRVGDGKA